VAQSEGPELKPQYRKTKQNKTKKPLTGSLGNISKLIFQ
jgi:hypothetical protein